MDKKPVVASYLPTFLKEEMYHIYRQITQLNAVDPFILTYNRENENSFYFEPKKIVLLKKHPARFFRRLWYRQLRGKPWFINRNELKCFLHELRKREAKVLHIYFGQNALPLLPLINTWKGGVIVSFHGADVGIDVDRPAYHRVFKEVFHAATLILARSHSLLHQLETLGCPPQKLRLHKTGIPLNEWLSEKRTYPHPEKSWNFVQACRFIEKKGLPITLKTFAKIVEKFPEATLHLAGNGPLKETLLALTHQLHIHDKVHFHGFLSPQQLKELFCQSHFFIHPSQQGTDGNQEGIPNALLEAMATGLPVLSTYHGGIPEAVEDNITGLLVKEQDTDALAAKTLSLMHDSAAYEAMSQQAIHSVRQHFALMHQVRVLEDYYREAMSS